MQSLVRLASSKYQGRIPSREVVPQEVREEIALSRMRNYFNELHQPKEITIKHMKYPSIEHFYRDQEYLYSLPRENLERIIIDYFLYEIDLYEITSGLELFQTIVNLGYLEGRTINKVRPIADRLITKEGLQEMVNLMSKGTLVNMIQQFSY